MIQISKTFELQLTVTGWTQYILVIIQIEYPTSKNLESETLPSTDRTPQMKCAFAVQASAWCQAALFLRTKTCYLWLRAITQECFTKRVVLQWAQAITVKQVGCRQHMHWFQVHQGCSDALLRQCIYIFWFCINYGNCWLDYFDGQYFGMSKDIFHMGGVFS